MKKLLLLLTSLIAIITLVSCIGFPKIAIFNDSGESLKDFFGLSETDTFEMKAVFNDETEIIINEDMEAGAVSDWYAIKGSDRSQLSVMTYELKVNNVVVYGETNFLSVQLKPGTKYVQYIDNDILVPYNINPGTHLD